MSHIIMCIGTQDTYPFCCEQDAVQIHMCVPERMRLQTAVLVSVPPQACLQPDKSSDVSASSRKQKKRRRHRYENTISILFVFNCSFASFCVYVTRQSMSRPACPSVIHNLFFPLYHFLLSFCFSPSQLPLTQR